MDRRPLVVVRNLRKRYGAIDAAAGVDFTIAPGEILGLLGPNGAGKTTTVECVIGLREPDGGDIEICGIDARKRPREVKEKIGAALQTTALQDKITPREALDLFGAFYRTPARPDDLLERFALTDKADAPFDALSGGQRQRLALALAFVNNPELVLLDEPTSGLDAQARRDLHASILGMKHDGHTVLLTTHHIEEAQQLCDRVAIIHRGRIIATGSPHELIAQSSSAVSVSFISTLPLRREDVAAIPGVHDVEGDGARGAFRTDHVTRAVAGLTAIVDRSGADLVELHVQRATLEDVFLELTGSNGGSA